MYGIISDIHFHNWTSFSKTLPSGINSRLNTTINAFEEAVMKIALANPTDDVCNIVLSGDVFHVRGNLNPSVVNNVKSSMRRLVEDHDVVFHVIPGNHDLESKTADWMMDAANILKDEGIHVYHYPTGISIDPENHILLIPWEPDLDHLKELASKWVDDLAHPELTDLIIHAPVNGIIKGIPDNGLEADDLAALGFKRVFAGHYHNHKELVPGKVWSVGALTHQTWGDVGSTAGYMIVTEDGVFQYATSAPQFVDITDESDPDDVVMLADGNFVRLKLEIDDPMSIKQIQHELTDIGALGIQIHPIKKSVLNPRSETLGEVKLDSLNESVNEYMALKKYDKKVIDGVMGILSEV